MCYDVGYMTACAGASAAFRYKGGGGVKRLYLEKKGGSGGMC